SLERLLDRTGEREQPLLDENRHFADEIHRLAALLEDTRVPFHAIGQFVDSALVGTRPIMKLAQLENRGADLVGKFPLFASIPLDPPHHVAALIIEGFEQSGKYQFCLLLPFGFGARDGVCDALLRVIEGRAARRKPRDQIPDRSIFLPSVSDVVDRRPCPYGSDRNLRHLDLIARPIGKAGIGGERPTSQAQPKGDGNGERPTSHVPPPGSPRRARNPRAGSYARIAPIMNSAVHPPTTASEIQLIWQLKCNAEHAHTAAANADQKRRTSCDFDMCPRGHTAGR